MACIIACKSMAQIGKVKLCGPVLRGPSSRRITFVGNPIRNQKKVNTCSTTPQPDRRIQNITPSLQKLNKTTQILTTIKSITHKKHETHGSTFTFIFPFGTRSFSVEQTPPNNKPNETKDEGKVEENKPEEQTSYIWRMLPSVNLNSGSRLWNYSGLTKRFLGGDLVHRFRKSRSNSRRRYKMNFDMFVVILQFFTLGTTGIAIVSTTAIISLLLIFANTFDFDDAINRFVCRVLTNSTGIVITYDSAKGSMKEQMIKLKKVHVVRAPPKENENHSAMDFTIEEMVVKLSGLSWLEGKGLVQDVRLRGVRGYVDRSTEKYDPDWKPTRRRWSRGDFDLDRVVAHDVLLRYTPPDPNQRPFDVSLFLFECGRLRKQWLLYDLLCAETIVGMIDDCLFKYAPIQTSSPMLNLTAYPFRMMQFKLDGLNTDIISKNASGPLGWIKEGLLDFDVKVMVPQHPFQEKPAEAKYYPLELLHDSQAHHRDREKGEHEEYSNLVKEYQLENSAYAIQMAWNLKLKRIKLNPPIFSPEMSYVTNAVIHPITAYMNVHSNHIDLNFVMNTPLSNFDGAWTPGAADLWTALSASVFDCLTDAINNTKKQTDFKKIVGYVYKYFFEKGSEEALKITANRDPNEVSLSQSSSQHQLAPQ